jgi:DNA primase
MAYTDFQELREKVSITQVADWLGIVVRGNGASPRGECPLCGDDRSFTITPAKGMWGCFKCGKKGSILDLVMEMRQVKLTEAAQLIGEHFLGTVQSQSRRNSTVPPRTDNERGLKPLDYLDPEHPAVDAVGFASDFAAKHGIGYSPKGIMRGTVAIPFRDEHGTLLGYIGITEEVTLPKDFKESTVVPLKRA